jgi:hypothetical protein
MVKQMNIEMEIGAFYFNHDDWISSQQRKSNFIINPHGEGVQAKPCFLSFKE